VVLYLGFGALPQKIGTSVLITQETLCENSVVAFSLSRGAHIATVADRAQPKNIDLDKNSVKNPLKLASKVTLSSPQPGKLLQL
jgi:hypothetical protein